MTNDKTCSVGDMFIATVVDPDALSELDLDNQEVRSNIRELLRKLRAYGIAFPRNIEQIGRVVEALPPQMRTDVIETLKLITAQNLDLAGNLDWDVMSPELLVSQSKLEDSVVFLEQTRGEVWRPPSEEMCWRCGDVEFVPCNCLGASQVLDSVADRRECEIPQGARRDEIWDSHFDLIARAYKRISVVDRYASKAFMEGREGLRWFLEQLSTTGRTYFTLYTMWLGEVHPDTLTARLRSVVDTLSGDLADVRVHLVDKDRFGRVCHHRFIRFGDRACLQPDNGLELFNDQILSATMPLGVYPVRESLRIENRLQDLSRKTIVVRDGSASIR